MSYAIGEITVPVLIVNDGSSYTITDPFFRNQSWTPQDPAYLRMMNATGQSFLVTMITSGDSFWLRVGDSILVPLAPNETGFTYVCKQVISTSSVGNFFLLTYFSNREEAFSLEGNSPGPPQELVSVALNGATSGTAIIYQTVFPNTHFIVVVLNNFRNGSGADQTLALPQATIKESQVSTTNINAIGFQRSGGGINCDVITALAAGGGTITNQATMGSWSFARVNQFDTLLFKSGAASAHTGTIILEGN
jgi:hypothetical protein